MLKLKAKCDQVQRVIDIMEKEFVDCIEKADAGNIMGFVIKGNGIEKKKLYHIVTRGVFSILFFFFVLVQTNYL